MEKIKRIVVIGAAGSGKTTFANELSKVINVPVIHLDKLYWLPNWENRDEKEWNDIVDNLVIQDEWILDGNYKTTFEKRFDRADLVIFLDINRFVCVFSILKRVFFTSKKKNRDDLADGCTEVLNFKFLRWSFKFNEDYAPYINNILSAYPNLKVLRFKSRKKAYKYIENLKNEK